MARLLHVPLALILCGAIPAGLKAGPIHDATGKASPDVAEFLIIKGADLEAKDKLGWTLLVVSANGGQAATAAVRCCTARMPTPAMMSAKRLSFRQPLRGILAW